MKKTLVLLFTLIVCIIGWLGFKIFFEGSSQTVNNAINKQLQGIGSINYIIQELEVQGGEVIFYNRNLNDDNVALSVNFVKKTWFGWKSTNYSGQQSSSSIKVMDHPTEQTIIAMPMMQMYIPKTKGVKLRPMIFGAAANPEITRIVVKNNAGLERQATIVEVNRNFKMYYVFVNESEGKQFEINGYNSDGTLMNKEILDDRSQSSAGTVRLR